MTDSLPTVEIGSYTYSVYISLDDAKAYLAADMAAVTWNDSNTDDDQRSAALVSMTRTLDRQTWQGTPTDPMSEHAFPRTGLVDVNGTPVDPLTVPVEVQDATAEGAALLMDGATFNANPTTWDNTRRLKAGSAEIEYFRPLEENASRFPTPIMELVGQWLGTGGAVIILGAASSGVGGVTIMQRRYGVNRGF